MAGPPSLSPTGERLAESLAPLASRDPEFGYALARFLGVLASLLDPFADAASDFGPDALPGYAKAWSPGSAPAAWLPWAAQFVGVRLDPSRESESRMRERFADVEGFRRGGVEALKAAARPLLTGTRSIMVFERHGDADHVLVSTMESETPDPAAVLAALEAACPSGIILSHATYAGGDYATLAAVHADYAAVRSVFTDYDAVRSDPSLT